VQHGQQQQTITGHLPGILGPRLTVSGLPGQPTEHPRQISLQTP